MSSKNIYANTAAEYESGNLLTKSKIKALVSLSFNEAIKRLFAYGFIDNDNQNIDMIINAQIHSLIDFIKDYSPSVELLKFLLSRFYNQDAKTTILGISSNTDYQHLLIGLDDFDIEKNYQEIEKQNAKRVGLDFDDEENLLLYLNKHKADFLRFTPFVRFFYARWYQIKNIRYILICLQNGLVPDLAKLWSIDHD